MKLSWDEAKRQKVLELRGLDFAQVTELFSTINFTDRDDRHDYGEERFVTTGFLTGRLCVLVWTPRERIRHIISLRKANDREKERFKKRMA
jgi:uncharacterized protein